MDKAIVFFYNFKNNTKEELEIPLNITAKDLILALNEAYSLGINPEDLFEQYLAAENPIAFLKGNKKLSEYGIRNGTRIIYKRG